MSKYSAALLLFFSASALAIDTFDATTNILKIDAVVLNGIQYNGVVVKLNAYEVVSVASSIPYVPVANACSSANFTVPIYNAITAGMSLDQVNQVIGCKYNPLLTTAAGDFVLHGWSYGDGTTIIQVYFDMTDTFVRGSGGSSLIKLRTGF